jgi:hypothetical protein
LVLHSHQPSPLPALHRTSKSSNPPSSLLCTSCPMEITTSFLSPGKVYRNILNVSLTYFRRQLFHSCKHRLHPLLATAGRLFWNIRQHICLNLICLDKCKNPLPIPTWSWISILSEDNSADQRQQFVPASWNSLFSRLRLPQLPGPPPFPGTRSYLFPSRTAQPGNLVLDRPSAPSLLSASRRPFLPALLISQFPA